MAKKSDDKNKKKKKSYLGFIITGGLVVGVEALVLANSPKLSAVFDPENFVRSESRREGDSYDYVAGDGEDSDLADFDNESEDKSDEGSQDAHEIEEEIPEEEPEPEQESGSQTETQPDAEQESIGLAEMPEDGTGQDAATGNPNLDDEKNPNAIAVDTSGEGDGPSVVTEKNSGSSDGNKKVSGGQGTDPSSTTGSSGITTPSTQSPTAAPTQSASPTSIPTPSPSPTPIPSPTPTPIPQTKTKPAVVTEDGELTGLSVKTTSRSGLIYYIGDPFDPDQLVVTAIYEKTDPQTGEVTTTQKILSYGGNDSYTISLNTKITGTKSAIVSYENVSARVSYTVIRQAVKVGYYGEVNGTEYYYSFPGLVNMTEEEYDGLEEMSAEIFAETGGVIDLSEMHKKMIAFLGDAAVQEAFAEDPNRQYNYASILTNGEDGYLTEIPTGFRIISGGQSLSDQGSIYMIPGSDWDSYVKSVADIVETVPDGYKIRRVTSGEDSYLTYTGELVLEKYTGTDSCMNVPMGVTQIALKEKNEAVTSIVIPESVDTIDFESLVNCLPNLTSYQVTGYSSYQVEDGVIYSKDGKTLLSVPAAKKTMTKWLSTVTTIAENAFLNSSVQTISVPDSVTYFKKNCFAGAALEKIFLKGEKPARIGGDLGYTGEILVRDSAYDQILKKWMFAFGRYGNSVIFGVYGEDGGELPEKEDLYTYRSDHNILVMQDDPNVLAAVPESTTGHYDIPEGIQAVASGAFANCSRITEVEIPASVTWLDEESLVFGGNVQSVTLQGSSTEVSPQVFGDPSTWKELTVYVSTEDYPHYLEYFQTVLDGVYGEGTAERILKIPEATYVYKDNAKYMSVTDADGRVEYYLVSVFNTDRTWLKVMDGTTCILKGAFEGCDKLEILSLPDSIRTIEEEAFADCSSLETVVGSVGSENEICGGFEVYEKGEKFKTFSLENGVLYGIRADRTYALLNVATDYSGDFVLTANTDSLSAGAFKDCIQMTGFSMTTPETLLNIGDFCFENCIGLKAMDLTEVDSLTMGTYLFKNCTGLKTLKLPDYLESTEDGLCYGCSALEEIEAYGIREIGAEAFYGCPLLTVNEESRLPWELVTRIGDRAFAYDEGLTEIDFPSVVSVGDEAFMLCIELTSASLSQNLEELGEGCFENCVKLKNVSLGGTIEGIKRNTFYNCRTLMELDLSDTAKSSITYIGADAFGLCESLQELDFSEFVSLKDIGELAMEGASAMVSVKLPASVETIMDGAFSDCGKLSLVTMRGSTPPEIGSQIFGDSLPEFMRVWVPEEALEDYRSAFTPVLDGEYGEGTTDQILGVIMEDAEILNGVVYRLTDEGRVLVDASPNLRGSYTILSDTVRVDDEAFKDCTNLQYIIFPVGSSMSIGDRVFAGCTSLQEAYFSGNVPEWGEDTFTGCTSLVKVNVGYDVSCIIPRIGTRAFAGCTALSDVTIYAPVQTYGEGCFAGCSSIANMAYSIDPSVRAALTTVEDYVFDGCTSLRVAFTNSAFSGLQYIGDYAFRNCDSLANPSVPSKVTHLGVGCFSECDNLLTVSIYGAVEEYPADCFKNCPKLTKTGGTSTAFASLKRIGDGAYENCVSLNSTTAGTWYLSRYTALESIGANAFKGCTSLTRDVEFSSTLNYIGADAFAGCSNLPEIILHSAEPPAFGTIGLAGLPSDFRILVPDSLESEDSIYLAYLEVLSEELGEEQAVAVLDSVSDGARARYLLKLEEEKKKKAEEKHTVEKMPAVETPEDGTPEESAAEEASEEETTEKETTDEGIPEEGVQAASVPEDPENSVDASREETLQETSDQSEAEDTQTDPEENGSSE